MADASDVCNTLVGLIAGTLYPNGTGNPSVANAPIKVFNGWPVQTQLDTDLAAGTSQVSVYPLPTERNVTRHDWSWQQLALNTATLALTIGGGPTVTVSGTVPITTPHNVAVLVNGIPYVYAVQNSDTLNSIAAALAALVTAAIGGTSSSGPVITFPSTARVSAARVGVTGTSVQELRRQDKAFQITAWCPSPSLRDLIAQPVDSMLAGLTFLTMPDGLAARIRYASTRFSDQFEKSNLWRRDFIYMVEYATTQTRVDAQVVATKMTVTEQASQTLVATAYD